MNYNFEDFDKLLKEEETINWREVVEKYIIYWKWILGSVLVAVLAGFIYGYVQKDVYEFKASMLIVDQSQSGQMSQIAILQQLGDMGVSGSNTMLNNEAQIIQSTELMKRVVEELSLHTSYTTRKSFKSYELYNTTPFFAKLDSLSLIGLKGKFEFDIMPDNGKYAIEGKYMNQAFEASVSTFPAVVTTPAGQLTIDRNTDGENPNHSVNVVIYNPVATAKYVVENVVQVEVTKQVDILQLSLKASNIQKGKDILNTLISIYNQDAIEQINKSAIYTAMFIDGRLNLLTSELGTVEGQIETYKKTNNLTNIETDAQLFLTNNSVFERQRVEAEIQLQLIKYVEQYINEAANAYALIPNLGLTDVGLVAVIQKYNELLMTRDRVAQGSSDENPVLKTLEQQVSAARKAIQNSIVSTRRGVQINTKGLTDQSALLQSRLSSIPRQEREFIEIKRQQQVKEALYLFMLQKREEASLSMAVVMPKGRILNAPDSADKVAPKKAIIMVVFFLLGVIIPIVIIFIRQLIYTKITNRFDVEKLTKVPVLTVLGHNKTGNTIIDHALADNPNAEFFRLLRAKLQFTLNIPNEKVILVTSTEPGEGKTFVSANLAISLSMMDKKVLLIGLDLRKPMMSKHFGISEKTGMSLYLSGHETDTAAMIHQLPQYPNLSLIPAGIIPPNPNELLMKERLDAIIKEMRTQYDYIVIDTAPVGAVADTFLIDRVSDLTLYVCRADYSDKRNIEFLNHIQGESSLRRLYLVVNDVDFEAHSYSYHGKYGLGYGYGKGYGTSV